MFPPLARVFQRIRSRIHNAFAQPQSQPQPKPGNLSNEPLSHYHGRIGETAARLHLSQRGYRFLISNFKSARGEIDLIFLHQGCLIFVEVKTRSAHALFRPASAVNRRKRRALERAAYDFLHQRHWPRVRFRFDIVEVLLEGHDVSEVRHLPDAVRFRHGIRL